MALLGTVAILGVVAFWGSRLANQRQIKERELLARQQALLARQQETAAEVAQLIPMVGKHTKGSWTNIRAIGVARRLGEIGPAARDALPALEKMAASEDPYWRSAAADAIKKISDR